LTFQFSDVFLPNIVKTEKFNMLFADQIRKLREHKQMPQRQLAAALEIDTATYCKIERGERRAKREHVFIIADIFETDRELLTNLWLAEQLYSVVKDESNAEKVLSIVHECIVEDKTRIAKQ
jgi:transcriptional regulator with XRE-family HTH domain